MNRKSRFLLISLLVLALDQWTKWMVELHLPFPSSHEVVPGFFHLSHLRNTGVAVISRDADQLRAGDVGARLDPLLQPALGLGLAEQADLEGVEVAFEPFKVPGPADRLARPDALVALPPHGVEQQRAVGRHRIFVRRLRRRLAGDTDVVEHA